MFVLSTIKNHNNKIFLEEYHCEYMQVRKREVPESCGISKQYVNKICKLEDKRS